MFRHTLMDGRGLGNDFSQEPSVALERRASTCSWGHPCPPQGAEASPSSLSRH